MYADCDGRESTTRYFAVRAASLGLFCRMSHKARSIWLRAAPAVTNFPDFTIIRDSSRRTFGYLWRNKGESHQVVVESWLSSSPDSATTNVPTQAAAVPAPLSAHDRSVSAASLTSGLARAACSGPGILNPIAGTTTQSGTIRIGAAETGTVSPCDVLTAFRTPTIDTSKRGEARPDISASSFAVSKASSTVARPVSKAPSSAST